MNGLLLAPELQSKEIKFDPEKVLNIKDTTKDVEGDFFQDLIENLLSEIPNEKNKNFLMAKLLDLPSDIVRKERVFSSFSQERLFKEHQIDKVSVETLIEIASLLQANPDFSQPLNFPTDSKALKTSLLDLKVQKAFKEAKTIKDLLKIATDNGIEVKNFEFFKEEAALDQNAKEMVRKIGSEEIFATMQKKQTKTPKLLDSIHRTKQIARHDQVLKNILSKTDTDTKVSTKREKAHQIRSDQTTQIKISKNNIQTAMKTLSEPKNSHKHEKVQEIENGKTVSTSSQIPISDTKKQTPSPLTDHAKTVDKFAKADQTSSVTDKYGELQRPGTKESVSGENTKPHKIKADLKNTGIKTTSPSHAQKQEHARPLHQTDNKHQTSSLHKSPEVQQESSMINKHTGVQQHFMEENITVLNNAKPKKAESSSSSFANEKIKSTPLETLGKRHTPPTLQQSNAQKQETPFLEKRESQNETTLSEKSDTEIPVEKNGVSHETKTVHSQAIKTEHKTVKQTFHNFAQEFREKVENYKPPLMKIKMQLNPGNLGDVDVTLINRGHNLHVSINANPNTIAIFAQNQTEFKNALVNMGFTGLQMQFGDNKDQQRGQNHKENSRTSTLFEEESAETEGFEMIVPRYV